MTLRHVHSTVILQEIANLVSDETTPYNVIPCTDTSYLVNIYFQRNPAVEPSVGCANPEAHPLVTCGLYSHAVDPSEALNVGQSRGPVDANGQAFQVVIRGSNSKLKTFLQVCDTNVSQSTIRLPTPVQRGL
jgi:hypothetical protein